MNTLFAKYYEEGLNIPTGAHLEPNYNSVDELELAVYAEMKELQYEYCSTIEGAIYFEEHYDMFFEETYYDLKQYLTDEATR